MDMEGIPQRCWKNCRERCDLLRTGCRSESNQQRQRNVWRKRIRDSDILTVKLENFANIDKVAKEAGKFDFVLADLGVSSMQIDNPDRGFTFKAEGPLDLRMNPEKGISAAERLHDISKEELAGMLVENADEPYAEEIAEAVTEKIRKGGKIETTTGLHQVIGEALAFFREKERKEAIRKSSQRVFQALRIDVNHEFEVLYDFLDKLPGVLKPGGRYNPYLPFGGRPSGKEIIQTMEKGGPVAVRSQKTSSDRPKKNASATAVRNARKCAGQSGQKSKVQKNKKQTQSQTSACKINKEKM